MIVSHRGLPRAAGSPVTLRWTILVGALLSACGRGAPSEAPATAPIVAKVAPVVDRSESPPIDGDSDKGSKLATRDAATAYAQFDKRIKQTFKYELGSSAIFKGRGDVIMNIQLEAGKSSATKCHRELRALINTYVSPKWSTVAVARQGTLWDGLRTTLFNTRKPDLILFDTKQQEAIHKLLTSSGDPDDLAPI